jgi:Common central domain of tyrosinase/Polyphenol oxidase middle domain
MDRHSRANSLPFASSRRTFVAGTTALVGAAALGVTAPSVFGQTIRTRMDIVTFAQDAARLAKFEAAMKEMQDRSAANPNDPKGWAVNANEHNLFCAVPSTTDPTQIHFCWWFLTWHRAYIAITERKIREISGDDTICYPYWNWSTDRNIPAAYAKAGSPLANAVRFARSQPPGLTDGEVGYIQSDPVLRALGVAALGSTFFEAKTKQDIPFSFGGIARPNPGGAYGNNALEGTPHGPVHLYVGGQKLVGGRPVPGDMTIFQTAGRDPIFFAHHGNLDRLWETWRRDAARKATEPTSDAFLKHKFVFTWLDGAPVEVPMTDVLDTTKLGYQYDYLDVFRPNAPLVMTAQAAPDRLPPIATQKLAVPLAAQSADSGERKYLEITGVQTSNEPLSVSVFVKPANALPTDSGTEIGTFAVVPSNAQTALSTDRLVFDITNAARQYGGQEITVELVPHRIGPDANQSFPPLKYDQMQIITRRQ